MRGMSKSRISDTSDAPRWLSADQVALAAEVTPDAVRRWIRAGRLQAYRAMPGSPWRIPIAAAADLLERLGRELPPEVWSGRGCDG